MAGNLQLLRDQVKSKVSRFKSYFESLNKDNLTESEVSQLIVRLDRLEPTLDQFENINEQLIEENPDEVNSTDQEEFETIYYELVANARHILKKYDTNTNNIVVNDSGSVASRNISNSSTNNRSTYKLPPIKLPTFDGKYQDWAEYKDTFLAIVDGDSSLTDSQKFYYLRSTLGKEVLEVIKSLEISGNNYSTAWKLLQERYENKSLIIHNHIQSIVEYPPLKSESYKELRTLYDTFKRHLRSLEALGESVNSWDRLIIYILANKFDTNTRKDWEIFKCDGDLPNMTDMHKFLKNKCEILEKLEGHSSENKNLQNKNKNNFAHKRGPSSHSLVVSNREILCYFCEEPNHTVYNCNKFLKLSVSDRIQELKRKKLCLNCFKSSHISVNCRAQRCIKCRKPHNVLIHIADNNAKNNNNAPPVTVEQGQMAGEASPTSSGVVKIYNKNDDNIDSMQNRNSSTSALMTECNVSPRPSQVLLSTAIINILINGKLVPARALLDSGSASNFIREDFCNNFNLSKGKTNYTVNGIGQNTVKINAQTNITIFSCNNSFSTNIDCLVIPKITDKLPWVSFDPNMMNIHSSVQLADPNYYVSSEIDLLLGSHVFWSIVGQGKIKLGEGMPILQNTALGWIIAGNVMFPNFQKLTENKSVSYTCTNIDEQIMKFWTIEEISNKNKLLSDAEKFCELHFQNTTKRNDEGRFVVNIPFKESLPKLGNSREVALKRFLNLEKKFLKNEILRQEYVSFMEEYKNLGHMTEIIQNAVTQNTGYFLPHHAVIKSTSLTTKCRVVFDASAKTDSGLSINDVQFVGPALQNDIFSILVRFRQFKYVMTADISKMYRQILIDKNQRCYQKIFWRGNTNESIKLFQLNTVSYGYASAPFLAVRCILQLARECENDYPKISKIISNSFYIDDLLTGADSIAELVQLQKDISKILLGAGFELRKWMCNDPSVLSKFSLNKDLPVSVLEIGPDENNKTLGVLWNATSDMIEYKIKDFNDNISKISKRQILSMICQIYDPLGLLGPIIIVAKVIIQDLWKIEIPWDANVPDLIFKRWLTFQRDLDSINNIKIPRQVCFFSEFISIELHGFADASEYAYGACVYVRCVNVSTHFVSVSLLCSKTRVAPIHRVTIPRLELSACVLLANLVKKVTCSLEINFEKQYFWTDSSVTLAWLKGDITRWKTYVANRVSEVLSLTDKHDWYHIRGEENPADLVSRGCLARELCENNLWWHGPDWLQLPASEWNLSDINNSSLDIPEQKSTIALTLSVNDDNILLQLINKFSKFTKLLRVVSYVFRFIKNMKLKNKNKFNESLVLEPIEIENSLLMLVKTVQLQCFSKEYNNLLENKSLDKKSNIISLNPFMHNLIMRVGGRLKNANLDFNQKHQLILPKGHNLVKLILKSEHERLLHCGVQQLLCSIRDKFWILSARNTCKKIVRECIRCFRAKPRDLTYLMGNLPSCRVKSSFPFLNVGLDYGGPFLLKDRYTRNPKVIKGYICLIVCMSTKAVHLEAVSDLTTAAFLNTLKRFISRRGKPANIYSDNGGNFIGANSEIKKLYDFLEKESEYIGNNLSNDRIKWHHIPPRAPSFGGLWESGIKSVKYHLQRILGNSSLTFEGFSTVLTEIEGILNSRPLCPMNSDPDDLNALTPAHFIMGRTLTALPEENVLHLPENRLNKYQRLQAILQNFWRRWHKEYLNELQTRTRWKTTTNSLKVGTMVLLKNDNAPPLQWSLGRITALYPGTDNVVRVVDVKTLNGVFRRAVTKLCPLPIE